MDLNYLASGLVAFASASILLWILEPVARHIGLVDDPGGRKLHTRPTPLIGGIAMFISFAFGVLWLDVSLSQFRGFFAATVILMVVGVLDDLHELSTRQRFVAQILASLIMAIAAGVVLEDLGHLVSPDHLVSLGVLALPVTVFAAVGVINAVNMSDGIDGLAGLLALISLSALGIIAWTGGDLDAMGILFLLSAVVLAFLIANLRLNGRALVFMGDAGSMFLGFALAWFLIQFSQGDDRLFRPIIALWIIALPLLDTVSIMARRVRIGRSPFDADREHFHHVLLATGFSERKTLAIMVILSSAAAGVGLAGHFLHIPEHWMFLGFLVLFALHHRALTTVCRRRQCSTKPSERSAIS